MILSYFEPDHQIIWLLLIENPVNVAAVADVVKFDSYIPARCVNT